MRISPRRPRSYLLKVYLNGTIFHRYCAIASRMHIQLVTLAVLKFHIASYLIYIYLGLRGININYISRDTTNGESLSWIQDLINRRDRLSVTGIDQRAIFDGDYDNISFNYPRATDLLAKKKEGDSSRSVLSIQAAQELVSC